jgi:hypothetical protein
MNTHTMPATLNIQELILRFEKDTSCCSTTDGISSSGWYQQHDATEYQLSHQSSAAEGLSTGGGITIQPPPKSPGRILMTKAFKTFSQVGRKHGQNENEGKKKNSIDIELNPPPLSVEARFDSVMRSITEERTAKKQMLSGQADCDSTGRQDFSYDDENDGSDGHHSNNHHPHPISAAVNASSSSSTSTALSSSSSHQRDINITDHSNRTFIVDNKKNKSQNRNLNVCTASSSNRNSHCGSVTSSNMLEYSYFPRSSSKNSVPVPQNQINSTDDYDGQRQQDQQQQPRMRRSSMQPTEYGILALKGQEEEEEVSSDQHNYSRKVVDRNGEMETKIKKKRSSSLSSIRNGASLSTSSGGGRARKNRTSNMVTATNQTNQDPVDSDDDLIIHPVKELQRKSSRRMSNGHLTRRNGISPGRPKKTLSQGEGGSSGGENGDDDVDDRRKAAESIHQHDIVHDKEAATTDDKQGTNNNNKSKVAGKVRKPSRSLSVGALKKLSSSSSSSSNVHGEEGDPSTATPSTRARKAKSQERNTRSVSPGKLKRIRTNGGDPSTAAHPSTRARKVNSQERNTRSVSPGTLERNRTNGGDTSIAAHPSTKPRKGRSQERTTRSVSPGTLERIRTNRPGRKKDVKKSLKVSSPSSSSSTDGLEKEDASADAERDQGMVDGETETKALLHRSRGRSPGSLREMRKIAHMDAMEATTTTTTTTTDIDIDHGVDSEPTTSTLSESVPPPGSPKSRRSTLSIPSKKSIVATGEATTDQSPVVQRRKGSIGYDGNRSRSPRSSRHSRKDNNGNYNKNDATMSRSPHRSLHKRRQSPGRLAQAVVTADDGSAAASDRIIDLQPPLVTRRVSTNGERRNRARHDSSEEVAVSAGKIGDLEASPPKRSSSAYRPPFTSDNNNDKDNNDDKDDKEDGAIRHQSMKKRSGSPKASRRPCATTRTTSHRASQVRESQSLIVKKSD